jgi:hypothetical protein
MEDFFFQLVRVYKEHTSKLVKVQEIIAQVDYKVKSPSFLRQFDIGYQTGSNFLQSVPKVASSD